MANSGSQNVSAVGMVAQGRVVEDHHWSSGVVEVVLKHMIHTKNHFANALLKRSSHDVAAERYSRSIHEWRAHSDLAIVTMFVDLSELGQRSVEHYRC